MLVVLHTQQAADNSVDYVVERNSSVQVIDKLKITIERQLS